MSRTATLQLHQTTIHFSSSVVLWERNKRHIAANLIHTHFQLHCIVLHLHCIAFALVCTECKDKRMNSAWVWHCIYRLGLGSGKWTDRAGYKSETSSTVATAVECMVLQSPHCHVIPLHGLGKKIVGWISFYLDFQICFKFSIWNFSSQQQILWWQCCL